MSTHSTNTCPKCGLEVPAGIATCPADGTALADALLPGAFAPTAISRPVGFVPPLGEDREPTLKRAGAGPISQTLRRDPLLGQTLGEYVVEELIGVGGMGLVYRGLQPVIGKPVAIKILRPEISDSPTHVERLLAEARAVNAVRHRGIIDIFNFGKLSDGRQYLVMEYLQGKALDEYIFERGVLIPSEAVGLLEEIAAALAAAHEAGVVHRDLKPNNIFLVKQGGTTYVKLLDFGLAKQTTPNSTTPQTYAGLVVGTPEYMAPEQARGEAIGPKTDLYALGVVAFQMLTGQLPFNARSPMEFLVQHLEYAPPRVVDLMPDVLEELSELVDQMLLKHPDDRPTSADQVRRELRRIARLLPQDVTYVGPEQRAPAPPLPVAASLAGSAAAHARSSGRSPRPPTPAASRTPAAPGGTTEPVLTPPAPAPAPRRPPWAALGAGTLVLLLTGVAGVVLSRAPQPTLAVPTAVRPPLGESPSPAVGKSPSTAVSESPSPAVGERPPPAVRETPAAAFVSPAPAPARPLAPPVPLVKPAAAPAPAPAARPAAAVAPPKTAPAAEETVTRPRPPRRPTRAQQLVRRIGALESALQTRPKHPGTVASARSMLQAARAQVDEAREETDYAQVTRGLDVWEQRFLSPKP